MADHDRALDIETGEGATEKGGLRRGGPSRAARPAAIAVAGTIEGDDAVPPRVRRLAASLRAGTVSASLILRRLGAYPRQNALAAGLREVGRVARTLFTLRWIADPELRRMATAELNKGEARNTLARAVCIHRLGRFRDRSFENQVGRAAALNLVTAAVVLGNTVYLGRAIDALRTRGEQIGADDLATLSPLGWEHVNITGDYVWEDQTKLDPDGFRQLVMPT